MRKILHTSRYSGDPWKVLQSVVPPNLFVIETLIEPSRQSLISQAYDADYFLVSGRLRIDEEVLQAAPRLKMIQRTGVGTEMLDVDAIHRHGIPIYVNSGINARSVAEHTVMLILACLKRLPQINSDTHNGIWKKQQQGLSTHELYGKPVGLVGMGNIGRNVAYLLNAFGARVYYTDVIRQQESVEHNLHLSFFDSFESMLPHVDIISFHCPLTDSNIGILNSRTLSLMKRGSIIVNTARGMLINENDLYDAICSGHISSAGLDTHFEEPFSDGYKLSMLNNVILTPHIGGLSYEAFYSMMQAAIFNIISFEEGRFDRINKEKLIV